MHYAAAFSSTWGSVSIAAAYALENHYFLLGGLTTYLCMEKSGQLEALLERIVSERLLIANTSTAVHTEKAFSLGSQVRQDEKGYVVNGFAAFLSLASEADIIWLQSQTGDGPLALLIDADNPGLILEGLTFPKIMIESDTQRVRFHNLRVQADARIEVDNAALLPGGTLKGCLMAWHLSLSAAQFLGGSLGAIDESRKFARSMKTWNGQPFEQLPNILSELGRMEANYLAAQAILDSVGSAIGNAQAAMDPLDFELKVMTGCVLPSILFPRRPKISSFLRAGW